MTTADIAFAPIPGKQIVSLSAPMEEITKRYHEEAANTSALRCTASW